MITAVYLFSDFGSGYNQYPYDGAEAVFRKVVASSSPRTRLFTHRDGERMYYGYLRHLDEGAGQYFGFAVLLQGVMLMDLKRLETAFEQVFQNIAIADRLISINERQHCVSSVAQLIDNRREVERVVTVIRSRVDELEPMMAALSPLRYGEEREELRFCSLEEESKRLLEMSLYRGTCLMGRVPLVREDGGVTGQGAAVAGQGAAQKAPQTGEQAQKEGQGQGATAKKRKKSPWRWILWLLFMGLLGSGGYYAFTQYDLLNKLLNLREQETAKLHRSNRDLVEDLNAMQEELEQRDEKIRELNQKVAEQDSLIQVLMEYCHLTQPLVVTSLYVTREGNDGYESATIGRRTRLNRGEKLKPHFRYVGLEESTARVLLRLTYPSGLFWFFPKTKEDERTIPVRKGHNTYDFGLWSAPDNGGWEPGKYVFDLIIDGQVVSSKEFTLE